MRDESLPINQVIVGDVLDVLRTLPDECVDCVVTSPPYWGLRDYGVEGQIGLEATPDEFVARMVEVFREVRRVLAGHGTCWVNLGSSYCSGTDANRKPGNGDCASWTTRNQPQRTASVGGFKPKDMVPIPWMVALALQADGWWLRQDIIWAKCLSGGVMLYAKTQKGVMPIMLKDLVRLDPATVQLWNGQTWTQVVSWTERPRPDSPLEITLRSGERIGCTAEHRWPTQRGLVRSDELQQGDVIDSCRLPGRDHNNPRYLDRLGWYIGHYIAEGSRSGSTLQIACHVNQMAEFFEEWKGLAECFGGSAHCHKTGGKAGTINVECKMVMAFIDQYVAGRTAKDKHLTRAAWHNNDMWLYDLLEGYLRGDGHDAGSVWKIGFTQNDYWAADLRAIAARIGASIHLCRAVHRCNGKEYPGWRGTLAAPSYRKSRCPDTQVVSIGKSRARHFYDVQVADEPHVFALASGVLTHNSNPMPESVTDRCTKAHEYVFLLTKRPRYWYDAEAVKEKCDSGPSDMRKMLEGKERIGGKHKVLDDRLSKASMYTNIGQKRSVGDPSGRNRRSVWSIPTQPMPEAHFATYPEKLVEPCILAGCPREVCRVCGKPRERVVERSKDVRSDATGKTVDADGSQVAARAAGMDHDNPIPPSTTIGWTDCGHGDYRPGIVLDPFGGSGTTGVVAAKLKRDYILIELNERYANDIARPRLAHVETGVTVTEQRAGQLPLFAGK